MVRNGWVSPFCFQTVYPFAGLWKPCFYLVRFPYSSSGWRMQPGCKELERCGLCSWRMVKMVGKMCFAWLKCFQHTVIVWIYQCVYEVAEAWFCENIGPLKAHDNQGGLQTGDHQHQNVCESVDLTDANSTCSSHRQPHNCWMILLDGRNPASRDWFSIIQFTLNLFPISYGKGGLPDFLYQLACFPPCNLLNCLVVRNLRYSSTAVLRGSVEHTLILLFASSAVYGADPQERQGTCGWIYKLYQTIHSGNLT